MGGESEKEWRYVYAYLIHFTACLKLTQPCKSTIFLLKNFLKLMGREDWYVCHNVTGHSKGMCAKRLLDALPFGNRRGTQM